MPWIAFWVLRLLSASCCFAHLVRRSEKPFARTNLPPHVVFGHNAHPEPQIHPWATVSFAKPRLRGSPLVAMMKATDLRKLDNATELRSLNGSRFRRVLGQRKMRTGSMIVAEVRPKQSSQVPLVED